MKYLVRIGGRPLTLELNPARDRVTVEGAGHALDARLIHPTTLSLLLDSESCTVYLGEARPGEAGRELWLEGREAEAEVADQRRLARQRGAPAADGLVGVRAPMAGRVLELRVTEGETVALAQPLLVLEAMKMQNEIRSPKPGRVRRLAVQAGAVVNAGQTLVEIE